MMARTDVHFDAMLRHLGAAYYESLHGRATRTDVARALDTVEQQLNEPPSHPGAARGSARRHPVPHNGELRHRRWARRVSDVMTTSVVTVDRITPYQEIDRLLTEHRRGRRREQDKWGRKSPRVREVGPWLTGSRAAQGGHYALRRSREGEIDELRAQDGPVCAGAAWPRRTRHRN